MKTGTVAILASCLLGQALAAPVTDRAGAIVVARDGDVNYGIVNKRVDDKVKDVLGNFGISPKDLDKDTLKKVEKQVSMITDTAAQPVSRFGGLGVLLLLLKPFLDTLGQAGGKDGNPLGGLLDKAGGAVGSLTGGMPKAGSSGSTPSVKRNDDGDAIKELLKALGIDGLLDNVTDTAGDITSKASGNKRELDNPLDDLFDILSGKGGKDGKDGNPAEALTSAIEDLTKGASKGAGDLTKTAGDLTKGLGKRQLDLGPILKLLEPLLEQLKDKAGDLTDKAGDAASSATSKLTGDKRDIAEGLDIEDLLKDLLSGLKDAAGDVTDKVKDTAKSAGDLAGDATKGLPGLGKRDIPEGLDLKDLLKLLEPILGKAKGAAGDATKAAGGAVDDLTSKLSGGKSMDKRDIPGLDLFALLNVLGPVLGPIPDIAGGAADAASGAVDDATPTPSSSMSSSAATPTPMMKRQDPALVDPVPADLPGTPELPPADADITPAVLPPAEGTEPLTIIFDDLSEVTSLLGEVEGTVPADQTNLLRETIDSFLASISSFLPEGAAPGGVPPQVDPVPADFPEAPAPAPLP